ncbi:glucosyltransferase domain-containing protein [Pseudomonas quasicaspiana]|nr:glucosyltransferase domain-containing protein [Pseudomonas quasicaspiana]
MTLTSRSKLIEISKWALLGGVLTVLFTLLLFKSPPLMPTVTIITSKFPGSDSQLFYKKNTSYSEIQSSRARFTPTTQAFEFPLPVYDDEIRWDPLETAGEFDIKEVYLNILWHRIYLDQEKINPTYQIEKSVRNGVIHFIAPIGSLDPQITITIPSAHLQKIKLMFSFMIAALIAGLIIAWIKWHSVVLEYTLRERGFAKRINITLAQDSFSLKEFLTLLGTAVVINILPMVNFFLSIDDEAGAYRTDPGVWIADGRWTAFLVEKFIFPQPVIPFVPNLFFYVCLAAAYMLILRAHRLKLTWITGLAYCIFIAHPIWWFIGEFYSNIPSTGLGVLCLSMAIYVTSRIHLAELTGKKYLTQISIAGLFLALAIGAYQSLVMFYIVVSVGAVIFSYRAIMSEPTTFSRPLLKTVGTYIIVFITGLLMYIAINKVAQAIYAGNRGYIDGFLRIDEFLNDPLGITALVFGEMWKIYTGSEKTFGAAFSSSGAVIGLAALFLLTQKTLKAFSLMFMFVVAMLIAPFLLHFATGALYLPLRSMLAVSFVCWIATVIILERKGILRYIGIFLSAILMLQMVSINGQYSASTILATTHDRFTAEALYSRMAALDPKFDRDAPIAVDVFGKMSFTSRYPAPASSTMSSSFFDWDEGNVHRMVRYMQLIGFKNLYVLENSKRIARTPQFKEMPIWPATGSVLLENGVYYIKLAEKPDPTHAKYEGAGK